MSRLGWSAAALVAVAFLAALAFTGGRSGPGLAPFTPNGLLTIPAGDVRAIEVSTRDGQWQFVRREGGWQTRQGKAAAGFEGRLEAALTLLRNSGPERILTDTEVAGVDAAQFGLDPPRLRVVVRGGEVGIFAISFGATNVLGLSHYARVDGRSEIVLLPGFVAEAWEGVGGMP
jgi:hypothetical protein